MKDARVRDAMAAEIGRLRSENERWKRVAAKVAYLLTNDEKEAARLLAGAIEIEERPGDEGEGEQE